MNNEHRFNGHNNQKLITNRKKLSFSVLYTYIPTTLICLVIDFFFLYFLHIKWYCTQHIQHSLSINVVRCLADI